MTREHLMPLSRWRTLGSDAAVGEDNVAFQLLERACRRGVWLVAGAKEAVAVRGRG